jgi:hypothetical protein
MEISMLDKVLWGLFALILPCVCAAFFIMMLVG